jgi:hypothetical protein
MILLREFFGAETGKLFMTSSRTRARPRTHSIEKGCENLVWIGMLKHDIVLLIQTK